MFARKRSSRLGDMAQLRREVEDILAKVGKDFEKAVDGIKSNEQVKQLVRIVHAICDKVKLEISKKLEFTKSDVVQVRKEVDQLLTKVSDEFRKEVSFLQLNEHFSEVKTKLENIYKAAAKQIGDKLEEYHVKDETVRIRIEVERMLSEISNDFEKQYDNAKDSPQVKELIKNFRKITEGVNKEVGKRLEDFKNDRVEIRREVEEMIKRISTDFEKTAKSENEKVKEMLKTAKNLANKVAENVSNMVENLKQKLNELTLRDEISQMRSDVEKVLAKTSSDFKTRVSHLQENDEIKKIIKSFGALSDKINSEIGIKLENLKDTKEEAQKDVEELLQKLSTDFDKNLESLKESGVVTELKKASNDVLEKANADINSIMDTLKQKLDDLKNNEKVMQVRKEVKGIFANIAEGLEKDFEQIKDSQQVNEVLAKFQTIHEKVSEDVNNLLEKWKSDKEKLSKEVEIALGKLSADFELAVDHIKENEQVKQMVQKVSDISTKLSTDLSKVLENLRENETVKKVVNNLEQGADAIKEKVKDLESSKIVQGIENKYDQLKTNASEVFHEIKQETDKIVSEAAKKVHDISAKISNGTPTPTPAKTISIVSHGYAQNEAKLYDFHGQLGKFLLMIWRLVYPAVWVIIFLLTSIPAMIWYCYCLFQAKDVANHVVVITGAGNGLGKALAKRFVRLGAKVACVDINTTENEKTAQELGKEARASGYVKAYTCDVAKPEQAKKLADDVVKDFGRVDILVNNAGILCCHKITDGSDDAIKRVIDVNLTSNFWMVRAFLPKMIVHRSGQIVFINSESAIHGVPMASSYAATKAGLLGLAYSLEGELRRDPSLRKIKVTSVHPTYFASRPDMDSFVEVKGKMLTVDPVADLAMHGIRRELFVFCIPMVYGGFIVSSLMRLLPPSLYDALMRAFVGGVRDTSQPFFRASTGPKKDN